jgi:hypothetical protein
MICTETQYTSSTCLTMGIGDYCMYEPYRCIGTGQMSRKAAQGDSISPGHCIVSASLWLAMIMSFPAIYASFVSAWLQLKFRTFLF